LSISIKNGRFSGTMGETFELMGSGMNFSYTALPSIDGNYGSLVSSYYLNFHVWHKILEGQWKSKIYLYKTVFRNTEWCFFHF
jgi:hypothetical protein